ncbi:FAD-binding protein [Candidatus Saccharibacteria bacterium]|nr:FAD-binding protein [Candidatus Saccharibacteria bacterium]
MKLGGSARFFADIHTPAELQAVYQNALTKQIPVFVLGGGSNVIAHDEGYAGLILRIRIPGFEIIADDLNNTTIKVGAGEEWDSVVKRTVDMRLTGIEALSAIPRYHRCLTRPKHRCLRPRSCRYNPIARSLRHSCGQFRYPPKRRLRICLPPQYVPRQPAGAIRHHQRHLQALQESPRPTLL